MMMIGPMPRVLTDQVTHSYGVLDPLVQDRRDTKFVYGGLDATTRNIIVLPQGGYRDNGGTDSVGVGRGQLQALTLAGATITAPNGGTAGNGTDGNLETVVTTAVVSGDPFVVLSITLGQTQTVSAVDVRGFLAADASASNALKVQYWNGSNWLDFGAAQTISTEARSRRFALMPGLAVSSNLWRVVIAGAPSIGAVTVGDVALYQEAAGVHPGKLFRAGRSINESYQLVLQPGHIDIWQDGVWRACCGTAITEAMLPTVKVSSAYDTVMLFHTGLETERLVRQDGAASWNFDLAPWENIPLVDYGLTYTNAVNEVQTIKLRNFGNDEVFTLTLEGNTTGPINKDANHLTTAQRIRVALESLSTVDDGLFVEGFSSDDYQVRFTGGDNAGRSWLLMTGDVIDAGNNAFISTVRDTEGAAGGEPLFSTLRGWPAVGRYAEGRLVLGGFLERPMDVAASVVGEPFNMDIERAGADAALLFTLDEDEESIIRDYVYRGSLMVFTASRVHYNATTRLSAEDAPNFKKSDAPGIDEFTQPLSLSNALFYVSAEGANLIQLTFSELEQNFIGEPASVLSSFLVDRPQQMAIRRANQYNDADVMWYINAGGGGRTVTIMRTQDVSGFAPHAALGLYRSVLMTTKGEGWFLIERDLATGPQLCLERLDDEGFLQHAIKGTNNPPSATLTGAEVFENRQVAVIADGQFFGFHNVANASITLPSPVSEYAYGFWFAPRAQDIEFRVDSDAERPMARLKRVCNVKASVYDTTSIAIAANNGPVHQMSVTDVEDAAPGFVPQPYTGTIEADGLPGFTREAQVLITQTFPGRLIVRGVRKTVVV